MVATALDSVRVGGMLVCMSSRKEGYLRSDRVSRRFRRLRYVASTARREWLTYALDVRRIRLRNYGLTKWGVQAISPEPPGGTYSNLGNLWKFYRVK
jgi:hypothetical protein